MNKLIFVEGLPSTGKSTTAKAVNEILSRMNYDTELYFEGDQGHPVDYDGVAYFNPDEFKSLKEKHSDKKEVLDDLKDEYFEGIVLPFKKALVEDGIDFGDELFGDIVQKDIYELSFERHRELILEKWKEFVAETRKRDKVMIFECCFIQNPMTVTMIRDGRSQEESKEYINAIAHIIKELNPILIYLKQNDLESSFKRVIEERPKEWYDGFIHYYTNQGYGLQNDLKGIDGTIQILKEREKRETDIVECIEINKHIVNNSRLEAVVLNDRLISILGNYYK